MGESRQNNGTPDPITLVQATFGDETFNRPIQGTSRRADRCLGIAPRPQPRAEHDSFGAHRRTHMTRIGFGFRFVAAVIDCIALAIIYGVCYTIFKPHITVTVETTFEDVVRQAVNAARWIIIINTLVVVGYSLTEVFKAASPGKMLMNLSIAGENGETPSKQTLWTRWGIKWGALNALNLLYGVTTL